MALLMNRKVVYAFNEMGLRRARSRGRKKKKNKKKKQKREEKGSKKKEPRNLKSSLLMQPLEYIWTQY